MRLFHSSSDIPSTIFQLSCLHYKRLKGFCKTPPTLEEVPKIPATVVFCPAHRPRRWVNCEKMEILRWHSWDSWGIPWIHHFHETAISTLGHLAILSDLLMFKGAAGFSMVYRLPLFTILNQGLQGRIRFEILESISISYGFSFCFPIVDGSILLWGNVYIHSSQLFGCENQSLGSYTQHHISPFPLKPVLIQ